MNDPIITNAPTYPSYISYASGTFSLTPLSGEVGSFIFLIRLLDKFNATLTVDFYFQIKINENQPPFFLYSPESLIGISPSSINTTTLPYFYDGENDPITVTNLILPFFATFDFPSRTFTFDPNTPPLANPPISIGDTYSISFSLYDGYKINNFAFDVKVTSQLTPMYSTVLSNQTGRVNIPSSFSITNSIDYYQTSVLMSVYIYYGQDSP